MNSILSPEQRPFNEGDLVVWGYAESRLLDILNGEYDLEEARADLRSLIGSQFDNRVNKKDANNTNS